LPVLKNQSLIGERSELKILYAIERAIPIFLAISVAPVPLSCITFILFLSIFRFLPNLIHLDLASNLPSFVRSRMRAQIFLTIMSISA
jgi:hypothetical protein